MYRKILACALLAVAGPALAVDGLLDSSFGAFATGRNIVAIDRGGTNADLLSDTLVAADGSIFLVGTSFGVDANDSRISLTRLTANGAKDLGFGNNGTVLSNLSTVSANRAKFDAAGNILIVGSRRFNGNDDDFIVCRYNQLGQSVSFSALTSNCATVAFDIGGGNLSDVANDIIVEPNGKLILVGTAGISSANNRAAAARLLPDGTLDTSFGSTGKRMYEPFLGKINEFNAIARTADGKYIAVGEAGDAASTGGTGALFARLTTNGSLDPSYQAGSGYTRYNIDAGDPFNRNDKAEVIEILNNGDILMAGSAEFGSSSATLIAFVYKIKPLNVANVDASFGVSGVTKIGGGTGYDLGDMLVQSDDKIVLIGTNSPNTDPDRDMQAVRLKSNGALDFETFGTVGRANIDFVLPGEKDYGIAGALQNGRIIVAGYSLNSGPANYDLTVAGLYNDLIFADNFD